MALPKKKPDLEIVLGGPPPKGGKRAEPDDDDMGGESDDDEDDAASAGFDVAAEEALGEGDMGDKVAALKRAIMACMCMKEDY